MTAVNPVTCTTNFKKDNRNGYGSSNLKKYIKILVHQVRKIICHLKTTVQNFWLFYDASKICLTGLDLKAIQKKVVRLA
jgi:hypothetical protein